MPSSSYNFVKITFLSQSNLLVVDVDRVVVVVVTFVELVELCGRVECVVGLIVDVVVIGIGYGLIKTNIK
jgi:hypothetical protein